jgi:hypothetical protein
MNNYVTLDGHRYKAVFGQYAQARSKPARARKNLAGNTDVTYGPSVTIAWVGEFVVPVTASGSDWGNAADLRTTYEKMENLTFTDHYGNSHTVVMLGELSEDTMLPVLDSALNRFIFKVNLVKAT